MLPQKTELWDRMGVPQSIVLNLVLLVGEWRPLVRPPFPRVVHHQLPRDDLHFQGFHPAVKKGFQTFVILSTLSVFSIMVNVYIQ